MTQPSGSLTLSPEQVAQIRENLATLRHNINNHLSLLIAGLEILQRKPEMAARLSQSLAQSPEQIMAELRTFSDSLEQLLQNPGA